MGRWWRRPAAGGTAQARTGAAPPAQAPASRPGMGRATRGGGAGCWLAMTHGGREGGKARWARRGWRRVTRWTTWRRAWPARRCCCRCGFEGGSVRCSSFAAVARRRWGRRQPPVLCMARCAVLCSCWRCWSVATCSPSTLRCATVTAAKWLKQAAGPPAMTPERNQQSLFAGAAVAMRCGAPRGRCTDEASSHAEHAEQARTEAKWACVRACVVRGWQADEAAQDEASEEDGSAAAGRAVLTRALLAGGGAAEGGGGSSSMR